MASAVRTVGATIETSASTAVAVMVVVIATSAASATNEVGAVGSASAASAENTASASSAAGKAKALGGADVDAARFPANKTYDRSRHRNKNVFVGRMDICDQLP